MTTPACEGVIRITEPTGQWLHVSNVPKRDVEKLKAKAKSEGVKFLAFMRATISQLAATIDVSKLSTPVAKAKKSATKKTTSAKKTKDDGGAPAEPTKGDA